MDEGLRAFASVAVIIFAVLAVFWKSTDGLNLFLKLGFTALMVWGALTILP